MLSKKMVAVCDILGFKEINYLYSPDKVYQQYNKYIEEPINLCFQEKAGVKTTSQLIKGGTSHLGIAWFSDTILLYTKEDTKDALYELITKVTWLVFLTTLENKMPLRVGVSYGDVYFNEADGIYIGVPLIEAYEIQSWQNWIGGVILPSAIKRICESDLIEINFYIESYKIPIKQEKQELFKRTYNDYLYKPWAINWTRGKHDYNTWKNRYDEATKNIKDESILEKWQNSHKYHNLICEQCRAEIRKQKI